MKVLVVGAFRYSNFGDILFIKLFYNKLLQKYKKEDIFLYETSLNKVSNFCRKELNYTNSFNISYLKNMDKLVYISGGYFSNSFEDTITKLLWHIRYALPGIYMSKYKKDVYVIGIGEGNFSWKISEKIVKYIFNRAKYIAVRNIETKQNLLKIGVKNNINITYDTALALNKIKDKYANNIFNKTEKLIFLHILPNEYYNAEVVKRIFPGIKKFIDINNGYQVVLGTDGLVNKKYMSYLEKAKEYFGEKKSLIVDYKSVDYMCEVLNSCDLIITPKLHVGIVASVFQKSVLAFPINYEKTKRFYNSIECAERCINLYDTKEEKVFELLNFYKDKPIILKKHYIDKATENLEAYN